ncbi:MAG: response regulator [Stellaceae bacterium]
MADNVLLIEDDPAEAQVLIEALADRRGGPCKVERVTLLHEALPGLKSGGISIVLLDLFLPDSQGVTTLDKLLHAVSHVPIVILSSLQDEDMAQQACQRGGAQDYLPKGNLGGYSLPLTLRSVMVRNSLETPRSWKRNERGSRSIRLATPCSARTSPAM